MHKLILPNGEQVQVETIEQALNILAQAGLIDLVPTNEQVTVNMADYREYLGSDYGYEYWQMK